MVAPFINLLKQDTLKQGCLHILSITKSFWLFLLPFPSFPVLPSLFFSLHFHCFHYCPRHLQIAPPPPILAVASSFVFPLLSSYCKADPACICLQPISRLLVALESSLKSAVARKTPSPEPLACLRFVSQLLILLLCQGFYIHHTSAP